jgi:hypothetical protein
MSLKLHGALHGRRLVGAACCVGAILGLWAAADLARADGAGDVEARYRQERQACMDGSSNQDRPTCLQEAGAARDAARRGQLDVADAKYKRNAQARCAVLQGDEARDCLARTNGEGTTSGSARAGGIYRETVTREVGPAVAVPASGPGSAPSR